MQSGGGELEGGSKTICRGLKDNQPSPEEEGKGDVRGARREIQGDRDTKAQVSVQEQAGVLQPGLCPTQECQLKTLTPISEHPCEE